LSRRSGSLLLQLDADLFWLEELIVLVRAEKHRSLLELLLDESDALLRSLENNIAIAAIDAVAPTRYLEIDTTQLLTGGEDS
jgi:hypothetical protein